MLLLTSGALLNDENPKDIEHVRRPLHLVENHQATRCAQHHFRVGQALP
ncbi:MAG: hypothetical protein OXM56_14255 [Gammaproteobacteria bacterium]|nr:hypothetical protein [Gammaproteobacteria bacterium]